MSASHRSGSDTPKLRSGSRIPINKQNHLESETESTPLMGDNKKNDKPSLATPEIDDNGDDREVVTKPYPGVDDGFFNNETETVPMSNRDNTETVPNTEVSKRTPEVTSNGKPEQHTPDNTDDHTDENDGARTPRRPSISHSHFPTESDYGGHHHHHHELEVGTGILEDIPDINVYQHKKTLAQGMMDLALFSANANQLRYVLDSYERHPYYYPSLIFICFSLIIQVAIGVLLIWNATYNVKDEKEVCRANKINNYTVIGIFLVTVVNVFISAFGVADPPDTPARSPS
ncbi:hypothetical protein HHI36_004207 [Cryptolaemus montrouzieri]|uniref:Ninjurin-1 n=1 Tax=Cryptolaemus montrouzieri TaxID=559131 RepID=A0ABD2NR67_9CUCU